MASLTGSTISGANLSINRMFSAAEGMTGWKSFYHCANAESTDECNPTYSCGWLHVRTPLPATNAASGIGWNPTMIEVVGYHSYSGEYFSDWKAVINNSGYADNAWYGSQVRVNEGNVTGSDGPVVYQSTNSYGGYQRVCFAIRKMGCCCNGWFWVRIRGGGHIAYREDYPWATIGASTNNAWY